MSPRGPLAFPCATDAEPSPAGMVRKFTNFRPVTVRPPSRAGLLIAVQFDSQDLPVTVSGEYCPMLPANPWLYTGGEPILGGKVIGWAAAPVVTEQEMKHATQ